MHPSYSVIIFTTASGAGYGLLVWLALFRMFGVIPPERWLGFFGLGTALGLITLGLLASTAHLGHPERAWRAFSQWRSSWLSREGIAAMATYLPAGLLGLGWVVFEAGGFFLGLIALLAIIGAGITVWCTGMIYASLPTIRQWYQPLVPPVYLAMAMATGGLLYNALVFMFGHGSAWSAGAALLSVLVALIIKGFYWQVIDNAPKKYTAEAATGLGHLGKVRPLDPPHTQPNFIMREMGFQVARKHAVKLRGLAIILAFLIPLLALVLALFAGAPAVSGVAGIVALFSGAVGVIVERWLFFAEAEHVAMLYYGAEAV